MAVTKVASSDAKPKVSALDSFAKYMDIATTAGNVAGSINNMVNPAPGSTGLPVPGYSKVKLTSPELQEWRDNPLMYWLGLTGGK